MSLTKQKYSGWNKDYEPKDFAGATNRRDSVGNNSILDSVDDSCVSSPYKSSSRQGGILRSAPSHKYAHQRVRFISPQQQRIEEEIAYHTTELHHLSQELVTMGMRKSSPDQDDASTIVSHDAFSVETVIEYAKPKAKKSSRRGRSLSPARSRASRTRSKTPERRSNNGRQRSSRVKHRDESSIASEAEVSSSIDFYQRGRTMSPSRRQYYGYDY